MFEEKVIATRPAGSIPWAWDSIDSYDRIVNLREHYLETEKIVELNEEVVDEFTTIYTRVWDSRESFDEFMSNPLTIEAFRKHKEYNEAHGIKVQTNY